MRKVVIDTNVIVAAAISSHGKSVEVMKLVEDREIQLYVCPGIMTEYKRVLSYKWLKIDPLDQSEILKQIRKLSTSINPPKNTIRMTDESDRIFYDTAKAVNADLITHNIKHFPRKSRFVMRPHDYISKFESAKK
jgi:putative PIN family toxin of toxin-antitoxin system